MQICCKSARRTPFFHGRKRTGLLICWFHFASITILVSVTFQKKKIETPKNKEKIGNMTGEIVITLRLPLLIHEYVFFFRRRMVEFGIKSVLLLRGAKNFGRKEDAGCWKIKFFQAIRWKHYFSIRPKWWQAQEQIKQKTTWILKTFVYCRKNHYKDISNQTLKMFTAETCCCPALRALFQLSPILKSPPHIKENQ